MPSYLLVMHQSGGCDYTIGCGTKTVLLGDCTLAEANAEIEQTLQDHGVGSGDDRVDEVELYEIKSVGFDFDGYKARKKVERNAEVAAAKEAKDRAELARLKAQYGG